MAGENLDTSAHTREDFLKALDYFMSNMKAHDKNNFLNIFSKNASIEDPVGSKVFKRGGKNGKDGIDVFYETNITHGNVHLESQLDVFCDMYVIRDIKANISPAPGADFIVHSYSFYRMAEEAGEIKIDGLAAYWEMEEMSNQISALGLKAANVSLKVFGRVLKNQGPSGMIDFMKAGFGIKEKGHKAVNAFVDAVNQKDNNGLISLFDSKDSTIAFPADKTQYRAEEFLEGRNAKIEISDPRSASWFTACRFEYSDDHLEKNGIALFSFNPKSKRITALEFFWSNK